MLKVNLRFDSLLYKLYERRLWNQIKGGIEEGIHPTHVALIMDGNRRYARAKRLPSTFGHRLGRDKLKQILEWFWDLEIQYVTLYAFSTENFERSEDEVNELMDLFESTFKELIDHPEFKKRNVRIKVIGRTHSLPTNVQQAIERAEKSSQTDKPGPTLIIAIGYGGRAEMIDAMKSIAEKIAKNEMAIEDINELVVERHLYTNGIPDPDLIIRTSGEERLSGFLTWQSVYSELYFADVYFPGFRKIDLWRAIRTYQSRKRRHGR
ncbi:di-trans,poly-cis-decaprenylcistransferase [Candidatus Heimdallarchaeota archaeon B3_Heim]|nr:MAG: di-trans,poly-cis-decaprenylcistransferase [Candidatus Heimdallarchaeota archaeon B3_Heim]